MLRPNMSVIAIEVGCAAVVATDVAVVVAVFGLPVAAAWKGR